MKTKKRPYAFLNLVIFATTFFSYAHCDSTTLDDTQSIYLPVTFSYTNIPIMEVVIENVSYYLEFNLGVNETLTLPKEVLGQLEKTPEKIRKWGDLKGNIYESPTFFIPSVDIGNLSIDNVLVTEEHPDNKETIIFGEEFLIEGESVGVIGRSLMERVNLFLNFPENCVVACNSLKWLQERKICPSNLIEVPFEKTKEGLVFQIQTDLGMKKFVLSSGSTISLIKASNVQDQPCWIDEHGLMTYTTNNFILGERNFGSFNLFCYEILADVEMDGMLGMDFLEEHVIYFDYSNGIAYIGDASLSVSDASSEFICHADGRTPDL